MAWGTWLGMKRPRACARAHLSKGLASAASIALPAAVPLLNADTMSAMGTSHSPELSTARRLGSAGAGLPLLLTRSSRSVVANSFWPEGVVISIRKEGTSLRGGQERPRVPKNDAASPTGP